MPDAGFRRAVLIVLLFTGATTAFEGADDELATAMAPRGHIITAAFDRAEP